MTARDLIMKLPSRVNPEDIKDHRTRFHFILQGEGGGDFTVVIENGACTVDEGLSGDPECTIKSKSDDFVKVVKGDLNPMMAVMSGKLSISNTSELLKYAGIFGLM